MTRVIHMTCWLLTVAAVVANAAEPDLVKAWLEVCRTTAERFEPTMEAGAITRLEQPVFRHAQPTRGNDIGAVWLWVDDARRPVAIADIFCWSLNNAPERVVAYEFHSLAETPFVMRRDDIEVWTPRRAGLAWRALDDAPNPESSKPALLRQARELTRRFSANTIDHQAGRWELRVTPQPVHTWDFGAGAERRTGALFAVCQGTDCELWLVLETRPTGPDQALRWHYALAAFTDYALEVRLDDATVWNPPRYEHGVHDAPHWINHDDTRATLPGS